MITSAILVITKIARITVLVAAIDLGIAHTAQRRFFLDGKDVHFAFGENPGRPQPSMSATVTLTATVTLDDEG
ncbi:hypothetical protein [Microtetraspora malaysiensis]|uniref:hypothetical protein n=1 Tax=Microtetraspora malaysiensis TaxID=161358 RepID=UPI00082D43FB|nr:hypothetical protein [Microtetraspora malaysiensis]